MDIPSREEVERLRKDYVGKRIRLIDMPEDPNPPPYNSLGTVQDVDGLGQLVMKWDNGSSLSLILGIDTFEVL